MKMEICLAEMNASDEITIRTEFHDYRFRLTDPVQGRGSLSGGVLGAQGHEAIFVGTSECLIAPILLQTGRRATFIMARHGIDQLTTSIITEISVSGDSESCDSQPAQHLGRQGLKDLPNGNFGKS